VRQANKGRKRDHSTTFRPDIRAVYLLVGVEVSSRLHRYSRKPHPVRISLGVLLHGVRAGLVRRQLAPQHNPRRDRDRGTRRLLKFHRGERLRPRARGGLPGAFHTQPLYGRRLRRSPAANGVERRLAHRHFPDRIRSLLRLVEIAGQRPRRKLRSPDDRASVRRDLLVRVSSTLGKHARTGRLFRYSPAPRSCSPSADSTVRRNSRSRRRRLSR
jgi:hypothetical protein